jgi:Mrp family chromosome partitioning ATPase
MESRMNQNSHFATDGSDAVDAVMSSDVVPHAGAPLEALEPTPPSTSVGNVSTPHFDESRTREEFRSLKRHVMSRFAPQIDQTTSEPRTILITSASPREGKTTVTLGLAMSYMFERNWRVILIDADMRSPELSRRSNLSEEQGLLDYLDDDFLDLKDVIYSTNVEGVLIIPAGRARVNAPELISTERMTQLLHAIHADHDRTIVIIDSGSILSCSETISLAQHAAHILFVVSKGQTKKSDINEGIKLLHRQAGGVDDSRVALILNRTEHGQSPVRYAPR